MGHISAISCWVPTLLTKNSKLRGDNLLEVEDKGKKNDDGTVKTLVLARKRSARQGAKNSTDGEIVPANSPSEF